MATKTFKRKVIVYGAVAAALALVGWWMKRRALQGPKGTVRVDPLTSKPISKTNALPVNKTA